MLSVRRILLLPALLAAACGDDDAGDPDAAAPPDAFVDLADADPCPNPTSVLPYDWRPIDEVSPGAVEHTAGAPNVLEVDASAGGTAGYPEEPFVYVAFGAGAAARVEITDVASYSDATWHLAFKRYLVRANGGDSGPGAVRVAQVAAATLDAVTEAPAAGAFSVDDWATADCELVEGPLGEPETAIGMWYDYDMSDGRVTPVERVYVLDLGGGELVKLRVATYYGDEAQPMAGAHYRIEWAAL